MDDTKRKIRTHHEVSLAATGNASGASWAPPRGPAISLRVGSLSRWSVVLLSGLALSCGNSNTGAGDGGRDVMGDVVEYGVNFRPVNNRYCDQIEASATPVSTGSSRIILCKPEGVGGTPCPQPYSVCVPINQFSSDLDSYVRDNRVPHVCTVSSRDFIEACQGGPTGGCGDGTFCVRVHHRFLEPSDAEICVPYPCNR